MINCNQIKKKEYLSRQIMNNKKGVVPIAPKHIEAGIAKYGGVIDSHLTSLMKGANLQYIPYLFNDGRILLVMHGNLAAFLYDDKDTLFEAFSLIP
jgi:hypothetical protein